MSFGKTITKSASYVLVNSFYWTFPTKSDKMLLIHPIFTTLDKDHQFSTLRLLRITETIIFRTILMNSNKEMLCKIN